MQLFTPLTIHGLTLKNRLVFAPTSVGEAAVDTYRTLAEGEVGLIVLPDVSIRPSMLGAPSLDDRRFQPFFEQVLDVCHQQGCKVSAQLFHPEYDLGYIGSLYRERGKGIDGDEVHRLLAENMQGYCDSLTTAQAEEIVGLFAAAAVNAVAVGFDMVQIHGDRLIGSFSSALFNHRADRFADRPAFAEAVVRAVRAALPDVPIDFKLTVRTETPALGRGGVLLEEVPAFVPRLEAAGVDSFHVAMANHSNIRDTIPAVDHPYLQGEGCMLHLARAVKQCATAPVCAVGKLQHAAVVERLLEEGFALAGLSRQLIADPLWGRKVREGRQEEICYCRYCNAKCVSSIMTGKTVGCILHDGPAK